MQVFWLKVAFYKKQLGNTFSNCACKRLCGKNTHWHYISFYTIFDFLIERWKKTSSFSFLNFNNVLQSDIVWTSKWFIHFLLTWFIVVFCFNDGKYICVYFDFICIVCNLPPTFLSFEQRLQIGKPDLWTTW